MLQYLWTHRKNMLTSVGGAPGSLVGKRIQDANSTVCTLHTHLERPWTGA
jgi:hypothetical protein